MQQAAELLDEIEEGLRSAEGWDVLEVQRRRAGWLEGVRDLSGYTACMHACMHKCILDIRSSCIVFACHF